MGQLRKQAKALSARVKAGDGDAAVALLAHSVGLGHGKLALRRLFLARAMGAAVPDEHTRYCTVILERLRHDVVEAMAAEENRRARGYIAGKTSDV